MTATFTSRPANASACIVRRSIVLAGQTLGIKESRTCIWLVSFMDYDLGYNDPEQKTLQPLDNLLGPS